MRTLRAIARSTTCWAFVGLVSLVPASRGHAQASNEFFRSATGTADFQATSLSDAELDGLRGRQLLPPAQPAKGASKRVVLWDEARTTPHPNRPDARNVVVIKGGTCVSDLRTGMIR